METIIKITAAIILLLLNYWVFYITGYKNKVEHKGIKDAKKFKEWIEEQRRKK